MRILWTVLKIIVGLAIAVPVGFFVLALATGVLGALLGLTIVALKIACLGLAGYAVYRLARHILAPAPQPSAPAHRDLPLTDPYYEAAMRELNSELTPTSSSRR
jgi:hypothetical protein